MLFKNITSRIYGVFLCYFGLLLYSPCVTGYHSNTDWAASCQDGDGCTELNYVSFHLHLSHNLVDCRGTTWVHGNQLPPPFFVFSSVYYIANWKACPLSDVLSSLPLSTSPPTVPWKNVFASPVKQDKNSQPWHWLLISVRCVTQH